MEIIENDNINIIVLEKRGGKRLGQHINAGGDIFEHHVNYNYMMTNYR